MAVSTRKEVDKKKIYAIINMQPAVYSCFNKEWALDKPAETLNESEKV